MNTKVLRYRKGSDRMKKRRITILSLVCTAVISAAALSAAAESGYIRGDADGDGEVTIIDATAVQRKLADLPVLSMNEKAADVDGDGLSILDATYIQRFLADFENNYRIGEPVDDNTEPTLDEYELPFISS